MEGIKLQLYKLTELVLTAKKKQVEVQSVNYKAMLWCFDKGYRIYPIPEKECKGNYECNKYRIVIERATKKRFSEKTYTNKESHDKIWNIYEQLYKKQKKSSR